ncbi:MAG: U32 family peptidase, partial [Muribaculaceae bacterium]|nr:U32 family peptidase [Muribaculaceae bacterium]
RLPYDLTDSSGRVIVAGRHFLSLKDMNRLDNLEQLIDAGASSFKIEGRLKDVGYVKNITALYSARLDEIIRRNPDKYRRSSFGVKTIDFTPSAESVFNRGFTNYFLSRPEPHSLASIATPKSTGRVVGRVKNVHNNCVTFDKSLSIENGDGLGYFDRDGQFNGFRANRVEGNKVFTRDKAPAIAPGTEIYCNSDRQSRLISQRGTTPRRLSTSINLRRVDKHRIVLSMTTESGASAEVVADVEFQTARSPQRENRHRIITKLGDTIFIAGEIDDTLADDDFTAASVLTDLRRRCCEMLMTSVKSRYKTAVRRAAKQLSTPETVDFHENISNSLARKFYTDHGTQKIDDALEVQKPVNKEIEVMKCRYCLRRELGACLKTPNRNKLPNDLMLRQVGGNRRYRLEFDCKNCQMTVIDVTGATRG